MELKDLSKPLTVDQIEFRIQSINKGGYATILAYKDARCDMQVLNKVCGPLNWKREHSRDNHNCTVSIYNSDIGQWVGKEDTGTESMAEAQKGLASDSFKRSGTNWGIGIELYDYPDIKIQLNKNEFKIIPANGNYKERVVSTWELGLKDWLWYSEFEEGKISYLSAVSMIGEGYKNRFAWGHKKQTEKKQ